MRQAGILAAAGIVALEKMAPRLAEDHQRARRLARGLKANPGVILDAEVPATNMVFFRMKESIRTSEKEVEAQLKTRGILVHATGPRRFRLVTHYWIDDSAVDTAVEAFAEILH